MHPHVLAGVLEEPVTAGTVVARAAVPRSLTHRSKGHCLVCMLLQPGTLQATGKSVPRGVAGLHCHRRGLPPAFRVLAEPRIFILGMVVHGVKVECVHLCAPSAVQAVIWGYRLAQVVPPLSVLLLPPTSQFEGLEVTGAPFPPHALAASIACVEQSVFRPAGGCRETRGRP